MVATQVSNQQPTTPSQGTTPQKKTHVAGTFGGSMAVLIVLVMNKYGAGLGVVETGAITVICQQAVTWFSQKKWG